jgi:cyclophilin family peptidyl-prolyl cis-trans isomerase
VLARRLAEVVGGKIAPEIAASDPPLALLHETSLATASILTASDPVAEIAKWDAALAPKDGQGADSDPRQVMAEDLSSSISRVAGRLGPAWLEANHAAVADLLRKRASPGQVPELLLSLATVLLNHGLPDAALKLTDGLMEAYESASANQPAEKKEYVRGFMRRVPLAARLFATPEMQPSDTLAYDTMPESEQDQLVQFLTIDAKNENEQLGICRALLRAGMDAMAVRGYRRLDSLLSDRKHHVRLMRLRAAWASILLNYATQAEMDSALSSLNTILDVVGRDNAVKYTEFMQADVLKARWMARRGDLEGAKAWATAWLEANQKHKSKPLIEQFATRIDAATAARESERKLIDAEAGDLPRAIVQTTEGDMEFVLFADDAPNTVSHFIATAESGFWNGKLFHRFDPGFVAQAGGDDGTRVHDLPRRIRLEAVRHHIRGTISMAREGEQTAGTEHEDTAASDFFIMVDDNSGVPLNGLYAAFGRVVRGHDVVDRLRMGTKILSIAIKGKRPGQATFESLPPLFQHR